MYTFLLKVKIEDSKLALLQDDREIGSVEWPEERDMGRKLFRGIQDLLEKNHLKPQDIERFEVISELPDSSTSRRIAETVARVYTFGVSSVRSEKT